jgi:hypothetical protein
MRFGVCLALWTKQEWESDDAPAKAQVGSKAVVPKVAKVETPAEPEADKALTQSQVKQFVDACDKIGLDPAIVASKAQLNWDGVIMQSQLPLLRDAFTILKTGL